MLSFPYSNRFVWFYWLVANSALKHMLSKLGHCFLQCSSFLCVIYSFHLWKSQGQKSLHSFSINPWRMCVLWRIGLLNNVKMVQTFETLLAFLYMFQDFSMLEVISSHSGTFSVVGEFWKLHASLAFIGQAIVNIPPSTPLWAPLTVASWCWFPVKLSPFWKLLSISWFY